MYYSETLLKGTLRGPQQVSVLTGSVLSGLNVAKM